jgi:hypothetical protein
MSLTCMISAIVAAELFAFRHLALTSTVFAVHDPSPCSVGQSPTRTP